MRHALLATICLFIALTTFAQSTEGVINYTETIKIELPEDVKKRMADRGIVMDIPDSRTNKMTLHFNAESSIYQKNKTIKEEEPDMPMGRGRGVRVMRFGGNNNNQYYRDVQKKEKKQLTNMMGKDFRIEDEEEKLTWKITGKQAQLGQYQVMEAKYENEKDTVFAWFTPQIPVSTGPGKYSQLPGMILRVDINHGKRIIEANDIEIRPLEEGELEVPTDGKKVSQAQFQKIREDKIQELKEMYGEERAGRFLSFEQN
ncbi:MAG: GLPGLI family protein [Saprospiraceae bacterium]|nr:GLPGLI family protein [Saprospiraceae bacterium]